MQKLETDVLILGAGWSGLVAADFLSRGNKKISILERELEVGGLARTFEFSGFKFDIGGHSLFFKKKENLSYVKKILNGSLLSCKKNAKVFFNNKYLDYPPSISSVLLLGGNNILNISLDLLRLDKTKENANFEEWIKSNYGENLYKIYFKDYSEKVWGTSCDRLSGSWAQKRIGCSSPIKILKNFFLKSGYGKESNEIFYYPREGIGLLSRSLARNSINERCTLYKGARIGKITVLNNKLSSLSFIHKDELCEIKFKHLISSIPLTELINLFAGNLDADTAASACQIKYRNLVLVNFIVAKDLVTKWHWCYFPSKDFLFSRIHEPKFWSKHLAPRNKTLLCTEIFCDHQDIYWKMKDDTLADEILRSFAHLGLCNKKEEIQDFVVKRIEYAYPLLYVGFESPLHRVNDFLRSFGNLTLIGRNGTHSYFDMEDCLENVSERMGHLKLLN